MHPGLLTGAALGELKTVKAVALEIATGYGAATSRMICTLYDPGANGHVCRPVSMGSFASNTTLPLGRNPANKV